MTAPPTIAAIPKSTMIMIAMLTTGYCAGVADTLHAASRECYRGRCVLPLDTEQDHASLRHHT